MVHERTDKLHLIKIKEILSCKRNCEGNEKINHRLEENICK
jgi:hypothetical protein